MSGLEGERACMMIVITSQIPQGGASCGVPSPEQHMPEINISRIIQPTAHFFHSSVTTISTVCLSAADQQRRNKEDCTTRPTRVGARQAAGLPHAFMFKPPRTASTLRAFSTFPRLRATYRPSVLSQNGDVRIQRVHVKEGRSKK